MEDQTKIQASAERRRRLALARGAPQVRHSIKLRGISTVSYQAFLIPGGGLKPLTRDDAQAIILTAGMGIGFIGHSQKLGFYEIQTEGDNRR